MPANLDPIYSRAPDIQFSTGYMTAASTANDLSAGTPYLLYTADATNGGFTQKLRLRNAPAGATTATVFRLWINNGSAVGTSTNSSLFDEMTLPVTTPSTLAATANYEMPLNIPLPAGYRLYGTIGNASANGWAGTVIGGKY